MYFVQSLKDLHSYIYERDNYDYIKAHENKIKDVPRQLHRDIRTCNIYRDTEATTETQRHKDTQRERERQRHTHKE